jgi:hypothetical protein
MSIIKDITNVGLSFAVLKLYKEGKKQQDKDKNNFGKDDIAGSSMVTGAMLIEELSDGETNKHQAIATALRNLADQIEAEGAGKEINKLN